MPARTPSANLYPQRLVFADGESMVDIAGKQHAPLRYDEARNYCYARGKRLPTIGELSARISGCDKPLGQSCAKWDGPFDGCYSDIGACGSYWSTSVSPYDGEHRQFASMTNGGLFSNASVDDSKLYAHCVAQ